MDYIRSFFFEVNINDERQNEFILDICKKLLSYSYTNNYSFVIQYNGLNHFEIDELLKLVFQSNDIDVCRSSNSYIVVNFIYEHYTLERVLQICKVWYQPYIKHLRRLDKEKRSEWYQNSNLNHPEERMKDNIIDNIDKIFPGFNYLIDFDWNVNENYPHYGVGDLVFASDYGVYIVIETKWLSTNIGKNAQISRNNSRKKVKNQAENYRRYAQEKFTTQKVIGASFTNDAEGTIHFVDDQDARIAEIIAHNSDQGTEVFR
jgi:hypothetical protein